MANMQTVGLKMENMANNRLSSFWWYGNRISKGEIKSGTENSSSGILASSDDTETSVDIKSTSYIVQKQTIKLRFNTCVQRKLGNNNENTNISEQHIDGCSAHSVPLNLFIRNNNKLITVPILKTINHIITQRHQWINRGKLTWNLNVLLTSRKYS